MGCADQLQLCATRAGQNSQTIHTDRGKRAWQDVAELLYRLAREWYVREEAIIPYGT